MFYFALLLFCCSVKFLLLELVLVRIIVRVVVSGLVLVVFPRSRLCLLHDNDSTLVQKGIDRLRRR